MTKEQLPRLSHSFDYQIAMDLGVTEAIVFQHIHYWIHQNSIEGRNFHDGAWWTYNSSEKMAEYMPYLSAKQIKLALQNLCAAGYLIKGNYNKNAFDRTAWYTVKGFKKVLTMGPNGPMVGPKRAHPQAESGPSIYTSENPICKSQVSGAPPPPRTPSSSASPKSSLSPKPSAAKGALPPKSSKPLAPKKSPATAKAAAKIPVSPNVALYESELDALISEYGDAQTEWMINKLDAHKASTGRQYKSDYATMSTGGWVQQAYQEQQNRKTPSKTPAAAIQSHDQLAKAAQKDYSSPYSSIHVGPSYIEFTPTSGQMAPDVLEFSAHGFADQLTGLLHKRGYKKR